MENYKQGIFFGLAAYVLWGILPVYWKALELVSPFEILSSRFYVVLRFCVSAHYFSEKMAAFCQRSKTGFQQC